MNIQLMTLTEVERVEGQPGHFAVMLRRRPRFVDMDKCIACGECARKCPKRARDEFNEGLGLRKAIHVQYPQAVPLKYQIDPLHCIAVTNGRCRVCEKVCPPGAIRLDDVPEEITIHVGAIILASGFQTFDPTGIGTWGYGVLPNVIRAVELERYLSASGPTEGRLVRPSDGREVRRLAFLQCVGSRDHNKAGHGYCSSVCCMYAIKEALIAMDTCKDLDVSIFFTDMRTHGKDFERYYERARQRGVKFRRCRVHSLEPGSDDGSIYFRTVTDEGRLVKDEFDLVVLSVGMETSAEARSLAELVGARINGDGFVNTSSFAPVHTGAPGIYVCGALSGPKDIPQSLIGASAAAASAAIPLADVRYSLWQQKEFPQERATLGEEPRIGVFICHCGTNIARVVDVEALAEYAATLPNVSYVERNLFTCSQDTQNMIRRRIEQEGLNRIVVAACTPRTHESLFRETLKASGLNEYLFEMANIRNHASWVHINEPEAATARARDLVRMAIAKAGLLQPLPPVAVGVNPQAVVVGGGVAGMVSALGLADQGYPVHLVEKSSQLGGNARHLYRTWKEEPIPELVDTLVGRVKTHELITVHLKAQITHAEGFVGNFKSTITKPACTSTINHGVAILATGAQAYRPEEYGYGHSPKVLTSLEFDKLHLVGDERIKYGRGFVFIQCVGSRTPERPYCSRVCCTHAIQSAIGLMEEDPDRNVFVLYRDIRAYGLREELYRKAREMGVVFIRYQTDQKPEVRIQEDELGVVVWDHVLHEPFLIPADVLILATAIIPHPEVRELANLYRVPVDGDGFLQEAHVKLRPVDFASDGLFLAGLAHYPKPIEEVIVQAQAVVARASTLLSNRRIVLDSIKAFVDEGKCDGCALCLDVCPYHAITMAEKEKSPDSKPRILVHAARCKGCGSCQATCPKDGINVGGFTYSQLSAQVEAALSP